MARPMFGREKAFVTPIHLPVGAVTPWSDLTTDELDAELRAFYRLIRAQCAFGAHIGYDEAPADQVLSIIDAASSFRGDEGCARYADYLLAQPRAAVIAALALTYHWLLQTQQERGVDVRDYAVYLARCLAHDPRRGR